MLNQINIEKHCLSLNAFISFLSHFQKAYEMQFTNVCTACSKVNKEY